MRNSVGHTLRGHRLQRQTDLEAAVPGGSALCWQPHRTGPGHTGPEPSGGKSPTGTCPTETHVIIECPDIRVTSIYIDMCIHICAFRAHSSATVIHTLVWCLNPKNTVNTSVFELFADTALLNNL